MLADILIAAGLLVIVFLIVRSLRKNKKSCGGGCAGCPHSGGGCGERK